MKIIMAISIAFVAIGFIFMILYEHTIIRYTCIVVVIVISFLLRTKIKEIITIVLSLKK